MRITKVIALPFLFAALNVSANEYPTIDSVREVVSCMAENGEQSEETLYACSCRFDRIKAAFTFREYSDVSFYLRNKAMPGEKGAVIRDLGKATKDLRARYEKVETEARKNCPIAKRVVRKTQ